MTNKQDSFLKAMLQESTISKAAEAAGISRNTAYRYLNDPGFIKQLEQRRRECINDVVHYLQGNLSKCAEVLMKIIQDETVSEQVKINAINTVFATYKSLGESAEITARLEIVEGLLSRFEEAWSNQ